MRGKRQTDTVVVGGGLAGLAAGALLARAGRRVALFEKTGTVGGRATTQSREGFAFNQGAHALYRAGAAMRLLTELGIRPSGATPPVSGGHAVQDGVKHALPTGFFSLLTTGLLGVSAKVELARLLGAVRNLDPTPLQGFRIEEGLERIAHRHEVRRLLAALFRLATYANDPSRQSAGAALEQLKLALAGNVLYLDGGWQQLVDGLRSAAASHGVEIVTGARVTAVECTAGSPACVRGVRLTDGSIVPSQSVILATPPADAGALVADGRGAALADWARAAIPIHAACLDVALARLPRPRSIFALGIDRPLYLSVHSAVARLAPERGALVHTLVYLDPSAGFAADATLRELEALLDSVQPGWRDLVVHRRFLPQMVVSNSLVTAAMGGTAGRPGPEVPGVQNLFVAGDWVGSEGMLLDASLASAHRAAELCARVPVGDASAAA